MVIEIRPIPEHETPGWLESLSSSFVERVDAHRPGALGAIQPNMTRLMEDIRGGTFDLVLTKPEDARVLSSVREFQVRRIVDIVIGAIVLGRLGSPEQGSSDRPRRLRSPPRCCWVHRCSTASGSSWPPAHPPERLRSASSPETWSPSASIGSPRRRRRWFAE